MINKERDALSIISNKDHKIEVKNTIPLVDDLEIQDVFKVENGGEEGSVIDLMEKVS